MKVLLVHNYYLQPGGEDTAFFSETKLLRDHDNTVINYVENNQRILSMNKIDLAVQTLWSWDSYSKIKKILVDNKPEVAHFHNTFPLVSPSAYYACRVLGVPVIQSLDNPRLLCPSANFYRNGKLCQDCLGKTLPWPSVIHACYHGSSLQTAVVASMLSLHRVINTWHNLVDVYLVASKFYRQKFIEGGFPAEKITIKPHFIYPDPNQRDPDQKGEYALFIGRLDPEKGVRTMLEAWKRLPEVPLKIRGAGQLEEEIRELMKNCKLHNIEIIGQLSRSKLIDLIKNARFLVWPSEGYYETFGYVAVESFSCGIPVIASNIGVLGEIVNDGDLGLQFLPGDSIDLARKVKWAWEHPHEMAEMGEKARREYEEKYTAEKNYDILMRIYQQAIETKGARQFEPGIFT